jgi:hypothetical protein
MAAAREALAHPLDIFLGVAKAHVIETTRKPSSRASRMVAMVLALESVVSMPKLWRA